MIETYKQFVARKEKQFKKDLEKNKLISFKDVGRKGEFHVIREAWTFSSQHNIDDKAFIIERLRIAEIKGELEHKNVKVDEVQYRFGYYIVGKNGRAKNKWVWGQFCPLIPVEDLNKLLDKAKKEGTIK